MRSTLRTARKGVALIVGSALLSACQATPKTAGTPGAPVPLAPAAFRFPPKGTVVECEAGRIVTYLDQEQPDASLVTNGVRTESMIYNLLPAHRRAAKDLRVTLTNRWPLEVGTTAISKRMPFSTSDNEGDAMSLTGGDEAISAIRSERLLRPAGTFNACVIVRDDTSVFANSARRYPLLA